MELHAHPSAWTYLPAYGSLARVFFGRTMPPTGKGRPRTTAADSRRIRGPRLLASDASASLGALPARQEVVDVPKYQASLLHSSLNPTLAPTSRSRRRTASPRAQGPSSAPSTAARRRQTRDGLTERKQVDGGGCRVCGTRSRVRGDEELARTASDAKGIVGRAEECVASVNRS